MCLGRGRGDARSRGLAGSAAGGAAQKEAGGDAVQCKQASLLTLGVPVVPLVYMMVQTSWGAGGAAGRVDGRRS